MLPIQKRDFNPVFSFEYDRQMYLYIKRKYNMLKKFCKMFMFKNIYERNEKRLNCS